ncbi:MAG TPA: DMT family transporter [Thermotogota bacterium]|nr:DMT family transporter [Thermotogota bacterium]HPJ89661.1 DMT family transporter [Thermotogota bacterium]HPR96834.1 DMT family transporter [Thermotogota bacterium]
MAYLFWFITLILFSSLEVVSKPVMGLIDPFTMTFMRFFIGGLFLMLLNGFTRKKQKIRMTGRDFILILLTGSLNSIVSMTLLQFSIKFGNASSAATLISTNPIFTALFAALIIKEDLPKRKLIGILTGFTGILVFGFGMLEGDTLSGILLGVASAVTFALYSVLMKTFVSRYGSLRCTAYSAFFPSVIYGAALWCSGTLKIPVLTPSNWLIVLYLGIFVTGIAYVCLMEAIKRMGATRAATLFYLKPVLATLLASFFLSESVGILKISGMIIIIFSLFL